MDYYLRRQEYGRMFDCVDCYIDTCEADEYYMVHNHLWTIYGPKRGMLCIGCLEERMGRKLNSADFTDAPVNREPNKFRSRRLDNRLRAKTAKVAS